jgi:hypothetical protein
MKYYACYYALEGWEIMSHEERENAFVEAQDSINKHYRLSYLSGMTKFDSFKEAKAYVLMHLQGDVNELKHDLRELKKLKEKR